MAMFVLDVNWPEFHRVAHLLGTGDMTFLFVG
jgi:hypothetical protein